eukprot:3192093-Prymnesium_polylepis.1
MTVSESDHVDSTVRLRMTMHGTATCPTPTCTASTPSPVPLGEPSMNGTAPWASTRIPSPQKGSWAPYPYHTTDSSPPKPRPIGSIDTSTIPWWPPKAWGRPKC